MEFLYIMVAQKAEQWIKIIFDGKLVFLIPTESTNAFNNLYLLFTWTLTMLSRIA